MRITELIAHIKASINFGIYANAFPRNAKDCAFVRLTGGAPSDLYIPKIKNPVFQIAIRHEDEAEAERLANEMWELFDSKEHYTIGTLKVALSYCNQSNPIYLGTDKDERTIYSVNVTCKTIG